MRDLKFVKNQPSSSNKGNSGKSTLSALELPYSTLEEFLKYIERRAFHMAKLSTRQIDDAHDIVQEAMYRRVIQLIYTQLLVMQMRLERQVFWRKIKMVVIL